MSKNVKGGAETRTKRQQSAYDKLKYQRRIGKAKPPSSYKKCAKCGCESDSIEMAHRDYRDHDDLRPLCPSCNRKEGAARGK